MDQIWHPSWVTDWVHIRVYISVLETKQSQCHLCSNAFPFLPRLPISSRCPPILPPRLVGHGDWVLTFYRNYLKFPRADTVGWYCVESLPFAWSLSPVTQAHCCAHFLSCGQIPYSGMFLICPCHIFSGILVLDLYCTPYTWPLYTELVY